VKTGCLVVPHEFDEHLMLVVTGWTEDGINARHAFAVSLFDTETLAVAAKIARTRKKPTNAESLSRIMKYINVTMPSGFGDEINILTDSDPFAKERSYRDATAEIPFLLAVMLLEKTKGGLHGEMVDGATKQKLSRPLNKGIFRRVLDKISHEKSNLITPRSNRFKPIWYR
jgi:hypothetical protein